MHWDMGLRGVAYLGVMSLAFGAIAQVLMWRSTTHWLWLIASVTFFVSGLLISEGWFGSATEQDLQPNIDGLSRDEALLAIFPAIVACYVTWMLGRRRPHHRAAHA